MFVRVCIIPNALGDAAAVHEDRGPSGAVDGTVGDDEIRASHLDAAPGGRVNRAGAKRGGRGAMGKEAGAAQRGRHNLASCTPHELHARACA